MRYEVVPCSKSVHGSSLYVECCAKCGRRGRIWRARRNWWGEATYLIVHDDGKRCVVPPSDEMHEEVDRIYKEVRRNGEK